MSPGDPTPESAPRARGLVSECRAAYYRGEGSQVLGFDPAPCAACGQRTGDGYDVRGQRFHAGCLKPHEAEVRFLAFAGSVELRVVDAEAAEAVDAALSKALHAALAAFEAAGVVRVSHTVKVAVQRADDLSSVAAVVK